MRVIAGTAKGRSLAVAKGTDARPMLEMARGALFNSIGSAVLDARVLDLYAGSGAIGIEALSRGAAEAVFVEADRRSVAAIADNLERCGLTESGRVILSTVERGFAQLNGDYAHVFLDPPFPIATEWLRSGIPQVVVDGVAAVLKPCGRVYFRFEGKKGDAPVWPGLSLADTRRYGRSRICVYAREI